jgi:hypothetical protein
VRKKKQSSDKLGLAFGCADALQIGAKNGKGLHFSKIFYNTEDTNRTSTAANFCCYHP